VRPEVIAAFCEEYRAGATIDLEHERADRARGHRIRCPTLALWSASGLTGRFFEPLSVWRRWAESVRGSALACGHFLMEEAPEEVTAHLSEFLGSSAKTSSDLLDR
jgi:haloacetate dehalogenase